MRFFLEFAYDGTNFFGYQVQPNQISVQEVLENALSVLLKEKIVTTGAGRTDTGVHANQMFLHFDYELPLLDNLVYKLNAFLPKSITIYSVFEVQKHAHARFDALFRTYKYYISTKRNPFDYYYAYPIYHPKLNVENMQNAADLLLNHSDFKSFSKVHTDAKTTICTITEANFKQKNDQLIFTITANRFLRNMVRAIVGTLLEVGRNKLTIEEFNQVIIEKNRNKAGTSAPPNALFLEKISYPESIKL